MKKNNSESKLDFRKSDIVELNEKQLGSVNGGGITTASSWICSAAIGAVLEKLHITVYDAS